MKNAFLHFVLLMISLPLRSLGQSTEEVVVFLHREGPISAHFADTGLKELDAYARSREMPLKIVYVEDEGVPKGVVATPAIFYQNSKGRSFYHGRYTTLDRMINFIRTVKHAPRIEKPLEKDDMLTLQLGNASFGVPLKVTDLDGELPESLDQQLFTHESKQAIHRGFSRFHYRRHPVLPGNSRLFYADFYPYLSAGQEMFISVAVYSLFSCVEPVFVSELPVQGPWNERERLFEKAGEIAEAAILDQLQNLENGDALEIIREQEPITIWEDLGLGLPEIETSLSTLQVSSDQLATAWRFQGSLADDSPLLQFQFGAPIDHYRGEAKKIRVSLVRQKQNSLLGATGHVVVQTRSITMGDEGLDDHIFNDYLKVLSFPNATYEFTITEAPEEWQVGQPQSVVLQGKFKMIGRAVDLKATGTISVTTDAEGVPLLQVNGAFRLPLKALFGIDGPDGPHESGDYLTFQLNFLMSPDMEKSTFESALFASEVIQKKEVASRDKEYIRWFASNKLYKAKGKFNSWKVEELDYAEKELSNLKARLVIDINSLEERSKLLMKHLKGDKFFDAKVFSTAEIWLNGLRKLNKINYESEATGTIRGVSGKIPMTFQLVDEHYLKGEAWVDRDHFGIGTTKKAEKIDRLVKVEFRFDLRQTSGQAN